MSLISFILLETRTKVEEGLSIMNALKFDYCEVIEVKAFARGI